MYHLPLLPAYGPGSNLRSSAAPQVETPASDYPIPRPAEEVADSGLAYFSAPTRSVELADFVPSTSPAPSTDILSETETQPETLPTIEETPRLPVRQALPPDPETFAEVVFFAYGVVVFFGLDEMQERSILEDVQGAGVMQKALREERWEIEECHYEVRAI